MRGEAEGGGSSGEEKCECGEERSGWFGAHGRATVEAAAAPCPPALSLDRNILAGLRLISPV